MNPDKSMESLISLLQYMVDVIIKDMADLKQFFEDPDPSTTKKTGEDLAAFQAADYDRLRRRDYQKRSSSGRPETPERKRRKGNFSTGSENFGPHLIYKTQDQLNQFIGGHLTRSDTFYNGVTWRYCEKCRRMGNHGTMRHRDKSERVTEPYQAPVPPSAPAPVAQLAAAPPPHIQEIGSSDSDESYYATKT